MDIGEHCRIRNAIIDKHNMIPRGTIIGYDRAADEKRYFVVDLGVDEKGNPQWLTVIPKERHSLQVIHPSADLSKIDGDAEPSAEEPAKDAGPA